MACCKCIYSAVIWPPGQLYCYRGAQTHQRLCSTARHLHVLQESLEVQAALYMKLRQCKMAMTPSYERQGRMTQAALHGTYVYRSLLAVSQPALHAGMHCMATELHSGGFC